MRPARLIEEPQFAVFLLAHHTRPPPIATFSNKKFL
jgi:hypothetical protein